MPDEGRILAQLEHIGSDISEIKGDVKEVKGELKTINGRVRENEKQIAVLSETCIKFNAVKIGAIIGAAIVIIGIVAWAAGIM